MVILLYSLLLAAAQATAPSQPRAQTPTTAPPRRAATATVEIRVTDRSGMPFESAKVVAEGPSPREVTTDASGLATMRNMTAGNYRLRTEREGFVTLEKEISAKAGAPATTEFALSAAPPPPPPPPPPP